MTTTVVEIRPRGDGVACAFGGELIVPRLVRRRRRSVDVALVAGRAMLLPDDDVRMRVTIGDGCHLRLVDIGGMVVYGRAGESGAWSGWHTHVDIGAGSHLIWEGLPTVVTDAGALRRSLTIRLRPAASALLRETLVLGRSGERGGRIIADTDAADDDGPILRESLDVDGDHPVPGILGGSRVVESIVTLGARPAIAEAPGSSRFDLDRGGSILRYLGNAAHVSPLAAPFAAAAAGPHPPNDVPLIDQTVSGPALPEPVALAT